MIRILTDSASDILPAEAEQLGVTVIPLNVTLEDGTVLRDGIDKTPSEYYALLKECHKLPTTSQPSPELFERFYQDAAAAGDEVLGIFLSHELSGTWQCARLAADLVNVDNVLFVDSANVCPGEGLLVRLAVQLRAAGRTLVQIATDLEHAKEHLHLVAAIDDLKYLRKGRPPARRCGSGRRHAGHQAAHHHQGRQGSHGRQGTRPARCLRCAVQKGGRAGRHQRRRACAGRLYAVCPRGAAHPDLPAGQPAVCRAAGAADRLRHRHPRRSRCLWSGLL